MLRSALARAGSMARNFEYVILGGGNAAGYACREFVAQNVGAGKVGVIAAEPVLPYERPALTKAYLHPPGAKVRARLPGFHTCVGGGGERQEQEWYDKHGISIIQGTATNVDLEAKKVTVGTETVTYGKLILATGVGAMRLSAFGVKGDELANVFYLRQESDAAALVKALEQFGSLGGRAVIVGGGYIGLECAAALKGWGLDTTMVFPEGRVMARFLNSDMARWLEGQYAARGIKLLKGESITEFCGTPGGDVSSVVLTSGATLPCDIAVVGVGSIAQTDFCKGLSMEGGGFKVDAFMQTSDPSVFAVGDICAFPTEHGHRRVEHVDHARKSAAQAVRAAMGVTQEPYKYLPYFYTRLFEYTPDPIIFNFFGETTPDCHVCRRDDLSLGAAWVEDGRVVGALLMGSPGPTPEDAKRLADVAARRPAAPGELAEPSRDAEGEEPPSKKARLEQSFEEIGVFAKK